MLLWGLSSMLIKRLILFIVLLGIATTASAMDTKKLIRFYFSGQQIESVPSVPDGAVTYGSDVIVYGSNTVIY